MSVLLPKPLSSPYCNPTPMHVFQDFFGSNAIIATVSTRSNLNVELNYDSQVSSMQHEWMDEYEGIDFMSLLSTLKLRDIESQTSIGCRCGDHLCCCKRSTVVKRISSKGECQAETRTITADPSTVTRRRGSNVPGVRTVRWGCWGDLVLDFEI
eukprot:765982-Hanusia_phi.AAC.2